MQPLPHEMLFFIVKIGPLRGVLGASWEPLWGVLEASWGLLGRLGALLRRRAPSEAALEASRGRLGGEGIPPWVPLARLFFHLGHLPCYLPAKTP